MLLPRLIEEKMLILLHEAFRYIAYFLSGKAKQADLQKGETEVFILAHKNSILLV